ncbi:hypothetical protein [Winogradskyella flava]|uniref:hypothetical protein n=1 Tax=Winogradskyella flava TaxID=1884876 RepID=UPI0024925516|nr:hypothetical protein [Winogradskyella flava]
MKSFNYLKFLLAFLIVSACSSDSNNNNRNQLANFTSQLCENVTGPTAGYWDNAHGLPLPLTQIPTIANPGQQFIHSQYPQLGFTLPNGYSGFENQQGIGVNVFRNDNQVVWRYVPGLTSLSQVNILDIVATEVNQLFAFYGHTGNFSVDCETNATQPQGSFIISKSSRLIRFGNFTGLVDINSYFDTSLGSTFASVSVASGPTAEFDNLVMNTFLPIHWQLLIIDNSVRDSDLDGTPDTQDNFPFDPQRQ